MTALSDTIQFTVIRGEGDWRVLRDGRDAGHFDFSVDAIESALVRATTLIEKGETVEVFVQDAAGQLRQVDPVGGEVLQKRPRPSSSADIRSSAPLRAIPTGLESVVRRVRELRPSRSTEKFATYEGREETPRSQQRGAAIWPQCR